MPEQAISKDDCEKTDEYHHQRVHGHFEIISNKTDYDVGKFSFVDIIDSECRPCCFLRYSLLDKANEEIRCLAKFPNAHIARSFFMYTSSDDDDKGVPKGISLVAVTKFEETLKEIAEKRGLFWKFKSSKIFGSKNNFRVFLVILTKLAYLTSNENIKIFVDDSDILDSIAFKSAKLEDPLVIRLALHSEESEKPMVPYLTCVSKLLSAIMEKQGVQASYPELDDFRSLLTSDLFSTRDSEELLLRHPALVTTEEKENLIYDTWKLWEGNRSLGETVSSNSLHHNEFRTWQNNFQNEHVDYQSRAHKETHDLVGLVIFARKVFAHIRDKTNHSIDIHTDEDIVDMLLRVSPNLFVELYRFKENL